jgi:hypothetical protein
MAYTTHYKINGDSLVITGISSIENERSNVLLSRKLQNKEREKLFDFLSTFSFNSLLSEYKNELIQDGDRKKIVILFNEKMKTIEIKNYYQDDLASLFKALNVIIGNEFKIEYENR